MSGVAEALNEGAVVQEMGWVRGREADAFLVDTPGGRYRALRAVSCLVQPEEGDRVLAATSEAGECFVLAVLQRAEGAPVELGVEGDLSVRLPNGRFTVASAEGVDIASTKDVRVVAEELAVNSRRGDLFFEKLAYVGRLAQLDVDRVKSVVGLFDQVVERITQKVKRSYRFVEELDVTRAEQIDMRAKQNVNVRGHNAVVSADLLVKMDGKQIHLG